MKPIFTGFEEPVLPPKKKLMQLKLVLVGRQSVGKSALLKRYVENVFREYGESTIGAAFGTVISLAGSDSSGTAGAGVLKLEREQIQVNIWDTAGMEKYKSLLPMYLRDADCVLLCFDHFHTEDAERQMDEIRRTNEDVKIILVRTKIDMAPSFNPEYLNSIAEELEKFAKSTRPAMEIYHTSAKTSEGVVAAFDAAIQYGYKKKKAAVIETVLPKLNDAPETKYIGCCMIM